MRSTPAANPWVGEHCLGKGLGLAYCMEEALKCSGREKEKDSQLSCALCSWNAALCTPPACISWPKKNTLSGPVRQTNHTVSYNLDRNFTLFPKRTNSRSWSAHWKRPTWWNCGCQASNKQFIQWQTGWMVLGAAWGQFASNFILAFKCKSLERMWSPKANASSPLGILPVCGLGARKTCILFPIIHLYGQVVQTTKSSAAACPRKCASNSPVFATSAWT